MVRRAIFNIRAFGKMIRGYGNGAESMSRGNIVIIAELQVCLSFYSLSTLTMTQKRNCHEIQFHDSLFILNNDDLRVRT